MKAFVRSGCLRTPVLAALSGMLISVAVDSAEAAGDHACDYLSKDEVAAVMGAAVGEIERQPANPMGQSVCFFDIPAGMQMRFAQLQMVQSAWATRAGTNWNARSLFENNMSFLSDLQEISGVGDKAVLGRLRTEDGGRSACFARRFLFYRPGSYRRRTGQPAEGQRTRRAGACQH
ncbi:MAG: hypothetical protein IH612_09200 [Desulfofustis sp.]|nr:hypothetical protein [Desulfofustis sp.]